MRADSDVKVIYKVSGKKRKSAAVVNDPSSHQSHKVEDDLISQNTSYITTRSQRKRKSMSNSATRQKHQSKSKATSRSASNTKKKKKEEKREKAATVGAEGVSAADVDRLMKPPTTKTS